MALTAGANHRQRHFKKVPMAEAEGQVEQGRIDRSSAMVVHVVLLAVPAAAGGLLHAFKFSILLWPFNLVLPMLRHLPRVCVTLRGAAAHYEAELHAYLSARLRVPVLPLQPPDSVVLRRLQRRPLEQLVSPAMLGLIDISY